MHIEPITIEAFFAHRHAAALLEAYARECGSQDLPPYCPNQELYQRMEQSGALTMLAAFEDDQLIGVLVLLVTMNPHYSVVVGVTESWFVLPEHRATGAGLELYRQAKATARFRGARALYVSAPLGGQLAGVMAGLGARETNRVFCEALR